MIDYKNLGDIVIDGIDTKDYPDFCDAFISYAAYPDRPLTDIELVEVNENSEFIYEKVMEDLF